MHYTTKLLKITSRNQTWKSLNTYKKSQFKIFCKLYEYIINNKNDEFKNEIESLPNNIINKNANKSVTELKQTILDAILAFLGGQNLADDLTLLLVKT